MSEEPPMPAHLRLISASASTDPASERAPHGSRADGTATEQGVDREPGADPEHAALRRAAGGDEVAVRALYRAHVDRVFAMATRILGRNDGDVEDVVQHTFLAALDGAARFDGRSKVSTWILGIATRRALDMLRERQRRGRWREMREWVGLGRPSTPPAIALEAKSVAERALMTLTPDQRVVFVLSAVEGHTLAEISEMTGVGVSTLHARLSVARKKLDELVTTWGPLELESHPTHDDESHPERGSE